MNETYPYLEAYMAHKSLKDLGFTFQGESLDDLSSEAFILIESEIKRLENDKVRRSQRNGRHKSKP
jgi:hypothetical protein